LAATLKWLLEKECNSLAGLIGGLDLAEQMRA
jgi:hypothetical protein